MVHEVPVVRVDQDCRVLFRQRCLTVIAVPERESSVEIGILKVGEFPLDARQEAQNAAKFYFVSSLKRQKWQKKIPFNLNALRTNELSRPLTLQAP